MWPCASCATTNEPHMIFCSSCGASRYKAPARDARSALPEEPAAAAPPGPRFEGTASAFAGRWVGWTLSAVFLGWIAQTVLFSAVLSAVFRSGGATGGRVISVVLSTFVFGGAVGWSQSAALRRSLENARVRWLEATLGGYFVGGLLGLLVPQSSWEDLSLSDRLLWSTVYGALGGIALGVAQAIALRKLEPAVGALRWILVSLGAHMLGNLAGVSVYYALTKGTVPLIRLYYAAGLAHTLVDALVTALPMGLVLGGCLSRRFGTRAEESS